VNNSESCLQRCLATNAFLATIDSLPISKSDKQRFIDAWEVYRDASKPEDFPLYNDGCRIASIDDLGRFRKTYLRLSEVGKCDDFGGEESQRVWSEWLYCDKPADVKAFIVERAHCPSHNWKAGLAKWKAKAQKPPSRKVGSLKGRAGVRVSV
jgi:hypothetical protein